MDPAVGNALAANVVRCIAQDLHFDTTEHGIWVTGDSRTRAIAWCLSRISAEMSFPSYSGFIRLVCHKPYLLVRAAMELPITWLNMRVLVTMVRTILQYDTSRTMCRQLYCALAAYFHRVDSDKFFDQLVIGPYDWPLHVKLSLLREATV
uniref:ORF7c protein n=1 Tax=Bat Coronavirus EsYN17 TaxID=3018827 RepID=A0AA49EDC3_9NIDO|nr:ORF7c protein [Bat Coronavirus EsYN17]WCC63778.1 ORF7c protein [Bat Coronavirus EsYN17]